MEPSLRNMCYVITRKNVRAANLPFEFVTRFLPIFKVERHLEELIS